MRLFCCVNEQIKWTKRDIVVKMNPFAIFNTYLVFITNKPLLFWHTVLY